jgi:hypothetical protein
VKILVIYGTTEGQTRKITRFITERLNHCGYITTLVEAGGASGEVDPRPLLAGERGAVDGRRALCGKEMPIGSLSDPSHGTAEEAA